MKAKTLKLITQYDPKENAYTVFRHNLTMEEANDAVRDLSARLYSLFVVDQRGIHTADDPDDCEACRNEVERTAHLQPKPTLKRRKS